MLTASTEEISKDLFLTTWLHTNSKISDPGRFMFSCHNKSTVA